MPYYCFTNPAPPLAKYGEKTFELDLIGSEIPLKIFFYETVFFYKRFR